MPSLLLVSERRTEDRHLCLRSRDILRGSGVIVCTFTHLPLDDLLRDLFAFRSRSGFDRPEDEQQAAQPGGCGELPGLEGGQQLTVPEADSKQAASQSTFYFWTIDQYQIISMRELAVCSVK